MTHVDHPFHVDGRGGTALTDERDHVRDLVEQVLFTSPGERVNRPAFGCGLLQLVFQPNAEPLAHALRTSVQACLQQELGDLVSVGEVTVVAEESVLQVTVAYTVRGTQEPQVEHFRSTT